MTLSRVFQAAGFTVFAVCMGACSSSSTPSSTPAPAATQDPGITPGSSGGTGTTPGAGTEVNPYGVAYPTSNLGYTARAGARPGSIMRNYKFLGYRDGDPSKGTTTISLADYFDPQQKQYKLIHFSAGALWCNPCNMESQELVGLVPTVKAEKVIVIQALVEGDAHSASTLPDLKEWQSRHGVNYTIFLDPEQANLGQFFEEAAIPWNAFLDPRSMEILSSGVGYAVGDTKTAYDKWLAWVDANPAQSVK